MVSGATPTAADHSSVSAATLKRIRLELSGDISMDSGGGDDSKPLSSDQFHLYQSVAARLNYLALDRPEIGFQVKEQMRKMSNPTDSDMCALKRCVRFLLSMPRTAFLYPWSPLSDQVCVYGDANWAGCMRTRKSTLGALLWLVIALSKGGQRQCRF